MGGMFSGIKDMFSGLWDQLTSMLGGVFDMLKGLMSSLASGLGSAFSGMGSMLSGIFHDGTIVGITPATRQMAVDASLFRFAPRLHTGLRFDEFPAVLQYGEEVTSRKDRSTILSEIRSLKQSMSGSGQQPVHVVVKSRDPDTQVRFRPSSSQQATSANRVVRRGERVL
jgi:hypothetical protein